MGIVAIVITSTIGVFPEETSRAKPDSLFNDLCWVVCSYHDVFTLLAWFEIGELRISRLIKMYMFYKVVRKVATNADDQH